MVHHIIKIRLPCSLLYIQYVLIREVFLTTLSSYGVLGIKV